MSATILKALTRLSRCHRLQEMITNSNMVTVIILSILLRSNSTYSTEWTMSDITMVTSLNRIIVRLVTTNPLWCCHCPRFSQAEDCLLSIPMEMRVIMDNKVDKLMQ